MKVWEPSVNSYSAYICNIWKKKKKVSPNVILPFLLVVFFLFYSLHYVDLTIKMDGRMWFAVKPKVGRSDAKKGLMIDYSYF